MALKPGKSDATATATPAPDKGAGKPARPTQEGKGKKAGKSNQQESKKGK